MNRRLQEVLQALDNLLIQSTNGRFRIVLWDHKGGQDNGGAYVYIDHAELEE